MRIVESLTVHFLQHGHISHMPDSRLLAKRPYSEIQSKDITLEIGVGGVHAERGRSSATSVASKRPAQAQVGDGPHAPFQPLWMSGIQIWYFAEHIPCAASDAECDAAEVPTSEMILSQKETPLSWSDYGAWAHAIIMCNYDSRARTRVDEEFYPSGSS